MKAVTRLVQGLVDGAVYPVGSVQVFVTPLPPARTPQRPQPQQHFQPLGPPDGRPQRQPRQREIAPGCAIAPSRMFRPRLSQPRLPPPPHPPQ